MNYRHSENKNLSIFSQPAFLGMPIYGNAPLASNYLESIHNTINKALDDHPRTFAFRVDLHLPLIATDVDYPGNFDNGVICRFIDSFKAKLKAAEMRKLRYGKRIYPCTVRYFWAKERNEAAQDHYHMFIFLNNDTYNTLGSYVQFGENNATRIVEAWASAIGVDEFTSLNLVHFPKQRPLYYLNRNSPDFNEQLSNVFQRASYFAKVTTKHYGQAGGNAFGCSRR